MPGKIEILPESVAQSIAAGEVVERPASVVKELMENAIDAGSSEITVELKAGGLRLIRVMDNGEGIVRDDVPLALQRYATSKVRKAEDLFDIRTLGFRGEALPSIAQVSKTTLRTRVPESISGTKLICEGGETKSISEIGCPVGTDVEVTDLFYNIPVKRKFLKSIRSELRAALAQFVRLSLSHPSISFKLVHDGRTLHEHLKTESLLVRVEAIFGKEIYRHLQPIGFEEGDIGISGFASLPSFSKRNAEGIYFYVNRRFIKDRLIYKAILDGYRHFLPGNEFPMVFFFITLFPSAVDVNVHPTKTEVKFKDPERVYQAVLAAIRALLENKETPFQSEKGRPPAKEWYFQGKALPPSFEQDTLSFSPLFRPGKSEQDFVIREGQGPQWDVEKSWHSPILGQIEGTYILCEREGHLIFIDQHAAHERILFEKFKREYESKSTISKTLLLPILIELSVEESCILESAEESLRRIGFEIESTGEKLFAIRSVPTFIDQRDPKEMVRRVLDELSLPERKGKGGEEILHAILITLACHSAIRANFPLRREEMDKLLADLSTFHAASTCPHGRPIFFVLPLEELRKQFKRR